MKVSSCGIFKRCYNSDMKHHAFTLAEVLITLGIIGVIAAIIMPQLITNYKKKVTAAKLKQAYSMVKQAYSLAEAEHGSIDNWEEFNIPPGSADAATRKAAVDKYILPYFEAATIVDWSHKLYPKQLGGKYGFSLSNPPVIQLKNGMLLIVTSISHETNNFVWMNILIYLDGKKGLHELGKDVFSIVYYKPLKPYIYIRKNQSGVYLMGEGNTAEQLKTLPMFGCQYGSAEGGNNGAACGAWIMENNWEIPDDYPW